MAKDDNRSAAGLRRSAIAERLRLREEWTALKEIDNTINESPSQRNTVKRHQNGNLVIRFPKTAKKIGNNVSKKATPRHNINRYPHDATSEVLRGLVVHVDVGSETRALPLRAALMALGASVVPVWNKLVTHLVWSEGGCRRTRSVARSVACRAVSPLWVRACAAAGRRLPERGFPAAPRRSDPPSPAALRRILKKLEQENIPLSLMSESQSGDVNRQRLRISSDTDASSANDTSADKTRDTSTDRNKPAIGARVNTAPRRAQTSSPPSSGRARRKLFTHREPDGHSGDDTDEFKTPSKQKTTQPERVQRKQIENRELVRKIIGTGNPAHTSKDRGQTRDQAPRIVLTGMCRLERQEVLQAVRQLDGRVQSSVNRRTTHVLLGNFEPCPDTNALCNKCNNPEELLSQMLSNVNIKDYMNRKAVCKCVCNKENDLASSLLDQDAQDAVVPIENMVRRNKPRTVNALLGAVRGCRVLYARWVLDSLKEKRWVHHRGYEVKHLKKMFEKARAERSALKKMYTKYSYNLFNGCKISISSDAEHGDAITKLLTLCGAKIQDGGADVSIGRGNGDICSKWVFDSIAAARMRTTRRYMNKNIPT